jgi:ABC-type transport system involved in multi-copper enzyme maturation permease subunit
MSRRHIRNILLKEWVLLFTDPNGALVILLLPFLVVGQGILYIWLAFRFAGESMLTTQVFQAALQKLVAAIPAIAQLPDNEQLLVLLLSQFTFFLLLIPTMIAMTVSTFSIVDEKLSGSLEALLATPVKTWELLLGKALAGAIPALVMTWISAGVLLLAVSAIGWGDVSGFVVTAGWFLTLFLRIFKSKRSPGRTEHSFTDHLTRARSYWHSGHWNCVVHSLIDSCASACDWRRRFRLTASRSSSFSEGIHRRPVAIIQP